MLIPLKSVEETKSYIGAHFYLCFDVVAVVYMYDSGAFESMSIQTCKELYLRPSVGIVDALGFFWSPSDWFFEKAPVHRVTSDHTRPRIFIENFRLTLNVYIKPEYPPFYRFNDFEQITTKQELRSNLQELPWLRNLVRNIINPQPLMSNLTLGSLMALVSNDCVPINYAGIHRLYHAADPNAIPYKSNKNIVTRLGFATITYPECFCAALDINIEPDASDLASTYTIDELYTLAHI